MFGEVPTSDAVYPASLPDDDAETSLIPLIPLMPTPPLDPLEPSFPLNSEHVC